MEQQLVIDYSRTAAQAAEGSENYDSPPTPDIKLNLSAGDTCILKETLPVLSSEPSSNESSPNEPRPGEWDASQYPDETFNLKPVGKLPEDFDKEYITVRLSVPDSPTHYIRKWVHARYREAEQWLRKEYGYRSFDKKEMETALEKADENQTQKCLSPSACAMLSFCRKSHGDKVQPNLPLTSLLLPGETAVYAMPILRNVAEARKAIVMDAIKTLSRKGKIVRLDESDNSLEKKDDDPSHRVNSGRVKRLRCCKVDSKASRLAASAEADNELLLRTRDLADGIRYLASKKLLCDGMELKGVPIKSDELGCLPNFSIGLRRQGDSVLAFVNHDVRVIVRGTSNFCSIRKFFNAEAAYNFQSKEAGRSDQAKARADAMLAASEANTSRSRLQAEILNLWHPGLQCESDVIEASNRLADENANPVVVHSCLRKYTLDSQAGPNNSSYGLAFLRDKLIMDQMTLADWLSQLAAQSAKKAEPSAM